MTAMEIESVFALESNTACTENVKPVSMVQEWADRDTGLQVALKEITERLGNLETKIQSVAQCSGAPETSSSNTSQDWRGGKGRRETGYHPTSARPAEDNYWRPTCYFCGQEGHIKRNCPLNFNGQIAGKVNGSRPGAADR